MGEILERRSVQKDDGRRRKQNPDPFFLSLIQNRVDFPSPLTSSSRPFTKLLRPLQCVLFGNLP